MRVIGRPTRPLPVPGPWGSPGPYQVYAGTRLKTSRGVKLFKMAELFKHAKITECFVFLKADSAPN